MKHGLPFSPLRLDGSPTVGDARVISFLSGNGGSGKAPITLELSRVLARAGKRTVVLTDSSFGKRERFGFQNPRCFDEARVALTEHEARDIRMQLVDAGVIDSRGTTTKSGLELFIYQRELDRLATKDSPLATLAPLKANRILFSWTYLATRIRSYWSATSWSLYSTSKTTSHSTQPLTCLPTDLRVIQNAVRAQNCSACLPIRSVPAIRPRPAHITVRDFGPQFKIRRSVQHICANVEKFNGDAVGRTCATAPSSC